MIRNKFKKVLQAYLRFKFRSKAVFPKNVIFGRGTSIKIADGSVREDIVISDNCYIYGRLTSKSGGKIKIDNNSHIGPRTTVGSVNSVHIKSYAMISTDITIMDNNNHPVNPIDRRFINSSESNFKYKKWKYSSSSPIVIGSNIWIGQKSTVLKGVVLGDNTIVASCSVVTKSFNDNVIVAGNPARVVKSDIDKECQIIC